MDGRKRCKKASVDEKRFICFQEIEKGGFRKPISVDRALKLHGLGNHATPGWFVSSTHKMHFEITLGRVKN